MHDFFTYFLVFLVYSIILYVIFVVILLIFNPEFYNSDDSINWLTPLWVVLLITIFIVIFMGVLVECF